MSAIGNDKGAMDEAAKEGLSDIARLDAFYHSEMGCLVASFLRKDISPLLRLDSQIDRLGFGYPFMCLPSIGGASSPIPVLIPSEMGALAYGHHDHVITASIASDAWPVASDSVNQIIISHGLEYCYDGAACLSEANRALASAGELVLMVPNRRRLWVRDEATPLGHGRPFSKGQVTKLLHKTGFRITAMSRALFLPPMAMRTPLLSARLVRAMDNLGHYGWGMFGAMMVVRATKLRYAQKPKGHRRQMVSLSGALRPVASPIASGEAFKASQKLRLLAQEEA
jgi:hypothetical protein